MHLVQSEQTSDKIPSINLQPQTTGGHVIGLEAAAAEILTRHLTAHFKKYLRKHQKEQLKESIGNIYIK